ncbi:MAG: Glu-tRNAGln amidotransferase subunit [Candidatus Parcubacteria bacterium]|jgi:aspartyl/glutamyl-tRNA(Asn/Gln) amidotransferase C subunit
MQFSKEDLKKLSELSRISITGDQEDKMLKDMQAILGYVSEINTTEGETVKEKESHYNVVREDIVTHQSGDNTNAILDEAPNVLDAYVKVAQVLK